MYKAWYNHNIHPSIIKLFKKKSQYKINMSKNIIDNY